MSCMPCRSCKPSLTGLPLSSKIICYTKQSSSSKVLVPVSGESCSIADFSSSGGICVDIQLRTIDKHRGKDQDDVNVSPVRYGKLFEQASCSSIPGCPGITLTATCIAFTLRYCYATSQADISARRHNSDQLLFDASRQYG